jgi:hypothetical protein
VRGTGRDRIPVGVRRTGDGLSVVPAGTAPLLAVDAAGRRAEQTIIRAYALH